MSDFIAQLPRYCQDVYKKSDPSLLASCLLPQHIIAHEPRHVACGFLLWVCAIDGRYLEAHDETRTTYFKSDLIEQFQDEAFAEAIKDVKLAFNGCPRSAGSSEAMIVSEALFKLIQSTKLYQAGDNYCEAQAEGNWRSSVITGILEVVRGFDEELILLQRMRSEGKICLQEWMNTRVVTIAARIIMIFARADMGLPTKLSTAGFKLEQGGCVHVSQDNVEGLFERIEILVQCIMGIENEIFGWEKDHANSNPLNVVEILIEQGFSALAAMNDAIEVHNVLTDRILELAEVLKKKMSLEEDRNHTGNYLNEKWSRYLDLVIGMPHGLMAWSITTRRYKTN